MKSMALVVLTLLLVQPAWGGTSMEAGIKFAENRVNEMRQRTGQTPPPIERSNPETPPGPLLGPGPGRPSGNIQPGSGPTTGTSGSLPGAPAPQAPICVPAGGH